MTAGKHDIVIEQGSDFSLTMNVKQGGGARDLRLKQARGSMRKTYDATTAHNFTFNTLDNTGVVVMEMPYATTAQLEQGTYVYDVEIFEPLSLLMGYYNNDTESVVFYSSAEVAAIMTHIVQNLNSTTLDGIEFFDIDGSGRTGTTDILDLLTYAATREQDFADDVTEKYQASYQDSALINKLTTGNVSVLNSTHGENVTRLIQGKVTVEPEVTRS